LFSSCRNNLNQVLLNYGKRTLYIYLLFAQIYHHFTLSVPDEGYSRNASYAVNLYIYIFITIIGSIPQLVDIVVPEVIICSVVSVSAPTWNIILFFSRNLHFLNHVIIIKIQLSIDHNFCSVHVEIISIRLYTPCNPRSGLRKGVYNLIEVISNEPN
jgi:hypothetical protein